MKSSILESIDMILDNCSDSNLKKQRIHLLPVYIEYLVNNQYPMPYLDKHSALGLRVGDNEKILKFSKGYFRVFRKDVLEY